MAIYYNISRLHAMRFTIISHKSPFFYRFTLRNIITSINTGRLMFEDI